MRKPFGPQSKRRYPCSSAWFRRTVTTATVPIWLALAGEPPAPVRFEDAPPPPLSAAEARTLLETEREIEELRRRVLTGDPAEAEALAERGRELVDSIRPLRERERVRGVYLSPVPLGPADPGVPALGPAQPDGPAPAPPADAFGRAVLRHHDLYCRERRFPGFEGPLPAWREWQRAAADFQTLTALPVIPGENGTARYVLRAVLLYGQSHLYASAAALRAGDRTVWADHYRRGIAALDWLLGESVAEAVGGTPAENDSDLLPFVRAYAGAETLGSDEGVFPGLRQVPTRVHARALLARYCPWGARSYLALDEAGYTAGLDPEILYPYRTDVHPNFLSEALLASRAPEHIRRDMEAFAAGNFDWFGHPLTRQWVRPPTPATYTVWFVSPAMLELKESQLVSRIERAIAAGMGAGSLALSVAVDLVTDALMGEGNEDEPVYAAVGDLDDAGSLRMTGEVSATEVGGGTAKLVLNTLESALRLVEWHTETAVFEGMKPDTGALAAHLGNPAGYDGAPVPPVLLRADAVALERVPDTFYPRQWHMIRYYGFDARGMNGNRRLDLTGIAPPGFPGRTAFLAGDPDTLARVWKPLPAVQGAPGMRLFVTDFAPKCQILRVSCSDTVRDRLREMSPAGTVATVFLEVPGSPNAVSVGPVGANAGVIHLWNGKIPYDPVVTLPNAVSLPELLRGYRLRICPLPAGTQAPAGMEMPVRDLPDVSADLVRLPVRFTRIGDSPRTGKPFVLPGDNRPGIVAMEQTVDMPGPPDPGPDTVGQPSVLPPALELLPDGVMKDGVLELPAGSPDFRLRAVLAPAEPGIYRAEISCGNHVYAMWARVTEPASAACFSGLLPAPAGTSAVSVRCGTVSAKPLSVRCAPPPVNAEQLRDAVRRAVAARDAATGDRARALRAAVVEEAVNSFARGAYTAGDCATAAREARGVLERVAGADDIRDRSMSLRHTQIREKAWETLALCAWATADGPALTAAIPGYLNSLAARIRLAHAEYGAQGTPPPELAAGDIALWIDRAVACGAPPEFIGDLVAAYESAWRSPANTGWQAFRTFTYDTGNGR